MPVIYEVSCLGTMGGKKMKQNNDDNPSVLLETWQFPPSIAFLRLLSCFAHTSVSQKVVPTTGDLELISGGRWVTGSSHVWEAVFRIQA